MPPRHADVDTCRLFSLEPLIIRHYRRYYCHYGAMPFIDTHADYASPYCAITLIFIDYATCLRLMLPLLAFFAFSAIFLDTYADISH